MGRKNGRIILILLLKNFEIFIYERQYLASRRGLKKCTKIFIFMNKQRIDIPKNIEYINQWEDYKIPRGEHCIVDKGVTGCGYTEMCLQNNDPIVLCSPRKLLLENKSEKHLRLKNYNIVYLDSLTLESMIVIVERQLDYCYRENLVPKFLITYDSTGKIIECLKRFNILDNFIFIVDEFQSIFLDSYFKVGVEFDFVNNLQECSSVVYLSATPMLEKYLVRLDEFKDLHFYKLDWSKSGFVETVTIERKKTNALTTECCKIVNNYLNNKFPMIPDNENNIHESKEAVFYFNSVSEILRVIRKCHLTPKNTLIVCSKSESNLQKLRKEGFTFGKIPLEDEPNPMFTFCTSAVYMGVDFYSNCASSYVFADPNVECLALDISLDLPQIIGRQRNKNNPFKNNIVLFYRTKRAEETPLTKEKFDEYQKEKRNATKRLLELYQLATDDDQRKVYTQKLLESIEYSNYSRDFVSISEKTGKPIYNSLIEIADERAWEVSQKEYQDTISVTKAINNLENLNTRVVAYKDEDEKIVDVFINDFFDKTNVFEEKMQMYCEFSDLYKRNEHIMNLLYRRTNNKFFQYYKYYGTAGCSAKKFRESDLLAGWSDSSKGEKLKNIIYSVYKSGDKIAMSEIKKTLKNIYESLGITKTAKATDLGNYFKLTKTHVIINSEVKHGFKLGDKLL